MVSPMAFPVVKLVLVVIVVVIVIDEASVFFLVLMRCQYRGLGSPAAAPVPAAAAAPATASAIQQTIDALHQIHKAKARATESPETVATSREQRDILRST